ncbi:hypothetical protein HY971_01755 [Candidatus Kaiserbacteria bacterium]|nr:hypothetical protein [Candidatus Kaiserbacteria bacterium]
MHKTQPTAAAAAAANPPPAEADWKVYDGHIPPMLLRMCRGPEATGRMLRKAMGHAKNYIPRESVVPKSDAGGPWRDAVVCGWGMGPTRGRIMILVPYRDRPNHNIEVRMQGDVTHGNVHVALRAFTCGLAHEACDAMDAK